MEFRRLLGMLVIAGFLGLPLSSPILVGAAEEGKQWEGQAEESFYLGRGMGRQLMTQEEWLEHQQKMRTLAPQERAQYRQEWHKKMMERAQERGITLPKTPGPHGRGMGPGGDTYPGGDRGRGYGY